MGAAPTPSSNEKNDVNKKSEVDKPADNFELQGQADLFGFGKTTVILADEAPNKVDYVEEEHIDSFSPLTAQLLHAYEWRIRSGASFVNARYEIANENCKPARKKGPLGRATPSTATATSSPRAASCSSTRTTTT